MDARVRTMVRAAAWTLKVCAPTVLEATVGRVRRDVCDDRIAWWSRRLVDDVGVRVEVAGRAHLEGFTPCVVMSNHQSLYDVPVLYQLLPGSVRMVAKKELFRIPIFGGAMRAGEFVEVDRENRARAVASLAHARTLFDSGVSVWIAPEGTRSPDGHLGPFKKGGFVLAEEARVPVLPISIDGTCRILPARTTDLHFGERVRVTVHAPARRASFESREAWMAHVRDAIASGLSNP